MNFFKNIVLTGCLLLALPACPIAAESPAATQPVVSGNAPLQEEMLSVTAGQLAEEEHLLAVLWVQRSAEFRGLCYQAYNLATMEVDKAVAKRKQKAKAAKNPESKKQSLLPERTQERKNASQLTDKRNVSASAGSLRPLAVVLDIDDTIVCHALLQGHYITHPGTRSNSDAWTQWIHQMTPETLLPGAHDFLQHAQAHDVKIFYVTGRGPQDREATLAFLQKAGLPLTDDAHLLMNDKSGSKMNHFNKIARRYDVICYLGDNAADFPINAKREENPVVYKKDIAKENKTDDNAQQIASADVKPNEQSQQIASADVKPNGQSQRIASAGTNAKQNLPPDVSGIKTKQNLPLDIPAMLQHDKNKKRNAIINANKKSFGTKFILLPNPMYGDWEYNLAKGFRRLPAEQRIALRKAVLKSFAMKENTK